VAFSPGGPIHVVTNRRPPPRGPFQYQLQRVKKMIPSRRSSPRNPVRLVRSGGPICGISNVCSEWVTSFRSHAWGLLEGSTAWGLSSRSLPGHLHGVPARESAPGVTIQDVCSSESFPGGTLQVIPHRGSTIGGPPQWGPLQGSRKGVPLQKVLSRVPQYSNVWFPSRGLLNGPHAGDLSRYSSR
jgi:hypothetical protein